MMMVFRVLCGEWIEPLWDCMRAEGELCMVVFLPTLVFGNFIVSVFFRLRCFDVNTESYIPKRDNCKIE
jgi:hypothetical protein